MFLKGEASAINEMNPWKKKRRRILERAALVSQRRKLHPVVAAPVNPIGPQLLLHTPKVPII
jgi:hypothetical protein